MAGGGDCFRYAVAGRVTLGGDQQKSVVVLDFQASDAAVAGRVKGVCQAKNSRQAQYVFSLARG
jgi:hypothetical protein